MTYTNNMLNHYEVSRCEIFAKSEKSKWSLHKIIYALSLLVASFAAYANSQNDVEDLSNKVVVWAGVEVITRNSDLIDSIRTLTGIKNGDLIRYSDPRLKQACDRVRGRFPESTIRCQGILMAN